MGRFRSLDVNEPAGIQYVGLDGISESCYRAVCNLVQSGAPIETARLLTNGNGHALLLSIEPDGLIAVKTGFASGYHGEGPRTLSDVLELLSVVQVELEEYEVPEDIFRRLGASALTNEDIAAIEGTKPVRPRRFYDYMSEYRMPHEASPQLLQRFKPVMPWAIIDAEIIDLALAFSAGPDKAIMDAFRRLEDRVRDRADLKEHSVKLFTHAFLGEEPALEWKNLDKSEQVGRAQLFSGAFQAFRNPRAHRELRQSERELLGEFLMVNQLFVLLRKATRRQTQLEPAFPKS